jgi:hypothetical protein
MTSGVISGRIVHANNSVVLCGDPYRRSGAAARIDTMLRATHRMAGNTRSSPTEFVELLPRVKTG